MTRRPAALIGSGIGWGSAQLACEDGPDALRRFGLAERLDAAGIDADWAEMIRAVPSVADRRLTRLEDALPFVADHNRRLADAVAAAVAAGRLPVTVGGDHSSAIGHYAGLARALSAGARLGIVWIDAHADLNTFETSPTMACYGMGLAVALGHGDPALTRIAGRPSPFPPQNVALVAVRDFDPGERDFIAAHRLRVFGMAEIAERGLEAVLADALALATDGTAGFGLTLDYDAIDPHEARGTDCPVPGGLAGADLVRALRVLRGHPGLRGIELSEYWPAGDTDGHTAELAAQLLTEVLRS